MKKSPIKKRNNTKLYLFSALAVLITIVASFAIVFDVSLHENHSVSVFTPSTTPETIITPSIPLEIINTSSTAPETISTPSTTAEANTVDPEATSTTPPETSTENPGGSSTSASYEPDAPENGNDEIVVNVKVYLEGNFEGTTMTTHLNAGGYLPFQQPYNSNPEAAWYYTGTESVSSIPRAEIVDWVLVELRDAAIAQDATPATILDTQAAFLLNDGNVVGLDGYSDLVFYETPSSNLFVVVYHRNHLGIISAHPLSESGGIYCYDFTTSADQAYGGSTAQKELQPGVCVMFAADVNGDGQVNNNDKFIWYDYAGLAGYYGCDINLDGQVNNPDKPGLEENLWNYGRGSQIPL